MFNSNFSNAQILVRDAVFMSVQAAATLGATIFITNEQYKGITKSTETVGFVFDVLKDEAVTAQADVTDHYVEANYAIHNHVAFRPLQITIAGFKGEVTELMDPSNYDPANSQYSKAKIQAMARTVLQRTNVLSQLVGSDVAGLQADAQELYNTAEQVAMAATNTAMWQMLDSSHGLYDQMTSDTHLLTKQERAFKYLYKSYLAGDLFFVQTPFGMFPMESKKAGLETGMKPAMLIQSIRAVQGEESTEVSDFEITFKEIRVAMTSLMDREQLLEDTTLSPSDKEILKQKKELRASKDVKDRVAYKGGSTSAISSTDATAKLVG